MLRIGENAWYQVAGAPHENVKEVYLSTAARKLGTYVIGTTGTGKSTLLLNLILQDIHNGDGLCVLDPHGDFTYDIMARIPDERIDREEVILFDPADDEYPLGLNLLEVVRDTPRERDLVVSGLLDTLYRLFDYSWGPRMEDLLRNASLTLLYHDKPATLVHLLMLLINYDHRQQLSKRAKELDRVLRAYWEGEFPESSFNSKTGRFVKPREQAELVGSSLNKIGRFLTNPLMRHIVGQPRSAFNLRQIMDEGKILLVNLSKGDIGADNAALLGSVLVNQLFIAALSRRSVPPEKRRLFHLYVDEYQNFATRTFPDLQSEARKYAIDTTVAHQYRDQLDELNQGSSLNVANLINLRVSGKDAVELARQFQNQPGMMEEEIKLAVQPYDEVGRFYVQRQSPQGLGLYEYHHSKLRMYADVEAEVANILTQLPGYQAIVRVLEWWPERPRQLYQYRIDLAPAVPVADEVAQCRIERIKAQSRRRGRHRDEVAREIAGFISAHGEDDELIPFIEGEFQGGKDD